MDVHLTGWVRVVGLGFPHAGGVPQGGWIGGLVAIGPEGPTWQPVQKLQ